MAFAIMRDWGKNPIADDLLALIAARLGAWKPHDRPDAVGDLDDLAAFGRATGIARVKGG